jgi:catechol 2,3-dioxygenase-like lactoylglutathione lyase family enzyme
VFDHVGLAVSDLAASERFYRTVLSVFGSEPSYEDHGGPGERAVYHPGYYAAFVLDPDGHNIEVVNHNQ